MSPANAQTGVLEFPTPNACTDGIDESLTSGPYGDTESVLGARWAIYELLLHRMAKSESLSTLDHLLARPSDEWHRVFDDPLLRIRLHEAYGIFRCGHRIEATDFIRLVKDHSEHLIGEREPLVVHAFGNRGTVGSSPLLVLDGDPKSPPSSIQEEFLNLFRSEILVNRLTGIVRQGGLRVPDLAQRSRLDSAFSLLSELLPLTTRDAARHATLVALAEAHTQDAEMGSGTARSVPGLVFMSKREMRSVWTLAEALLHELTHCKLFDLYLGRRIFRSDYDVRNAATIRSPWNVHTEYQSNEWPFDQALAAYHVYVHLAALSARITAIGIEELEARYGPRCFNESLLDAAARARYLGAQLVRHAEAHLSDDGAKLVAWLGETLDVIAPPTTRFSGVKYLESVHQQFNACPYTVANSGDSDVTIVLRHEPPELMLIDPLPFSVLSAFNAKRGPRDWDQLFRKDAASVVVIGELLIAADELCALHLIKSINTPGDEHETKYR
jgi:hypothetical protein